MFSFSHHVSNNVNKSVRVTVAVIVFKWDWSDGAKKQFYNKKNTAQTYINQCTQEKSAAQM